MAVFICQGCGAEHSSWTGKCGNCGTTEILKLSEVSDRMIGREIKGKFVILKKLGQGGMGAVYLAEQKGIGLKVALKFLKSEFTNDAEIARRFLNEAKSYAKVAHPNAVALHDFGQDEEGNLFIAMEYCEGVDLKRLITDHRRLEVGIALDIVMQVADVLAHAHSNGVVHRDLKPENIMVRQSMRGGHVKVLDFGIARLIGEGTRLTIAGSIAGTPRYMAPEQVEGRDIDHRADIYALGIVLFECLTGVQPFDGPTITEILRRQMSMPIPRLAEVNVDADYPAVDVVIQKACQKTREDRYQSMIEFATELAKAMPTQSGRPSFSQLNPVPSAPGLGETLVRQATPNVQVPGGLATPAPGASAPTEQVARSVSSDAIKLAAADRAGGATISSETLAVVKGPASNRMPLFVGGGVVAAVVLGVVLFRPAPAVVVAPPPPPAPVVVPVVRPADPPPVNVPGASDRDEDRGRDYLARARSAWDRGELGESATYLKDVPGKTEAYKDALLLQTRIKEINDQLQRAEALQKIGECSAAEPLFQSVLQKNKAVARALDGAKKCRAAAVPTQLE